MGGKSPQVVFADADLDEAAKVVAKAITLNTGQVCSAGSRLLVSVHESFVAKVRNYMKAMTRRPGESNPDQRQLEIVESYVDYAMQKKSGIGREKGLEVLKYYT